MKIRKVHIAAFPTDAEANLVDTLRNTDLELISLVAEENDEIIGHILFSPVSLEEQTRITGLAPMAVLPQWQRKGIGSQLVEEGLRACEDAAYDAVAVLGHPDYYPRFGFVPSVNYGINSEYDVPAEVFMLKKLRSDALQGVSGIVKYNPIFNDL